MKDFLVFIPVKAQSQRVESKNLRAFHNSNLLSIAIDKATSFSTKENIYLNTNSEKAIEISDNRVSVYKREDALCTNETTLDSIIFDFIQNNPCKKIILINTITPLLPINVLSEMNKYFDSNKLSSLVSGNKLKLHAFCNGSAVNFENKGSIPQTQNISPIEILNWGFGIWNVEKFIENYKKNSGRAIFNNEFQIFDTDLRDSIKISEESDFLLAEKEFKNRV